MIIIVYNTDNSNTITGVYNTDCVKPIAELEAEYKLYLEGIISLSYDYMDNDPNDNIIRNNLLATMCVGITFNSWFVQTYQPTIETFQIITDPVKI